MRTELVVVEVVIFLLELSGWVSSNEVIKGRDEFTVWLGVVAPLTTTSTISTLKGMSALREDSQELYLLSLSSGNFTSLSPRRRLTASLILSSRCGSLQNLVKKCFSHIHY